MTEQPTETPDESRLSRRTALKAAVGAGVGAVAWTGPKITAFGATPAYAAGCTNFTFKFTLTDINTDSSSACDEPWEMYHNPNINNKIGAPLNEDYYVSLDPGDKIDVCTDPPDEDAHTFFFPKEETCSFIIRLYYASDAQGNPVPPWAGEASSTGTNGSLTISWPGYDLDPSTINNSSLRWAIWIECYKDGDESCLPVLD